MNVIDLFSGVGGLGLGFEQAGFKNICSIDNWDDAIKTHNFNRKEKNVHKQTLLEELEMCVYTYTGRYVHFHRYDMSM